MKQSNYHFSFTIAINNTADKVWQTLTDVPNWHVWDTELIDAQLEGDFLLDARGEMTPKKGPKLKFYISEIVPLQSYTINTILPVGELVIKRSLKTEQQITYFTDDIAFTGFLKYLLGFMLGKQFRSVLPEVMQKFKQLAESK
jgi:hypothetical protein